MSLFDLAASRLLGLTRVAQPAERKDALAPYTWPAWTRGQPDWTPPSLANFAAAGYGDNAIIYACISRKAQSAALAPLIAYTGERAAPERLPDVHPLATLLLRPNPMMSWYEMQELLITYLDLDGNAFIYKALERNGVVTGLYPLRSDRVRPVPGRERTSPLLGYVYDPEDSGFFLREPYLPDEIIHVKYPNPRDLFEGLGRGSSPLNAAAKSADVDNAATSFLKTFFAQAVVPFGLFKTKQKLVDSEVQRIRDRLREQYGGSQNWGEAMVLDADAEYQRLGLSMQEMTFADLDARNEARICAALGVPPIIVGAKVGLDRSTFANYGEARRSFWEDSLIPGIYRRFEDGFNGGLGGDGVWLAYDYGNVPALAENRDNAWLRATNAWVQGVTTRNEARAEIKLPPSADGDIFKDQIPPALPSFLTGGKGASVAAASPFSRTRRSTPEQGSGGAGEQGRKAIELPFDPTRPDGNTAQTIARLRREMELRIGQEVEADLQRQLREIIRLARAGGRPVPESAELLKLLLSGLQDTAILGAAAGVARLAQAGVVADWHLVNGEALSWARSYGYDLVRGIEETTRGVLQREVSAWIESGAPLKELEGHLVSTFGPVRAEMIASTEVTRAFTEGKMASWAEVNRQYGVPIVTGRRFLTANDELVCPICSALGGLTWSEDGSVPASRADQRESAAIAPLDQGFTHPGGNGAQARFEGKTFPNPPVHPRCRCDVVEAM